LRGRLALERGKRRRRSRCSGRDRAVAHQRRGARARGAALELGDETRAFSELREATRAEPDATDAALLLARFYYARGNYDQAIEFALRHTQKRGTGLPAAHQIGIWSHTAKWNFENAHRLVEDLRKHKSGDFVGVALAEEAQLVSREKGADAARQLLSRSVPSSASPPTSPRCAR
jgi:tetratricopeptide (TPR) repeat protein